MNPCRRHERAETERPHIIAGPARTDSNDSACANACTNPQGSVRSMVPGKQPKTGSPGCSASSNSRPRETYRRLAIGLWANRRFNARHISQLLNGTQVFHCRTRKHKGPAFTLERHRRPGTRSPPSPAAPGSGSRTPRSRADCSPGSYSVGRPSR